MSEDGRIKRIGVVENVSYDGSLVVRCQSPPRFGSRVVDKRSRPLGKVVKVFGPVREPFASVRPTAKLSLSVLGSEVYASEGNDAVEEGRRGRRSH